MMRRILSIFLILQFWPGPLAAVLQANSESRLPACCRRHGAHHCDMTVEQAMRLSQASSGSAPVFAHPARCSSFPESLAAPITSLYALAAAAAALPAISSQAALPAASCPTPSLSQLRVNSTRGPPPSAIV
ncbi:MAG: hypothetical protein P4K86_05955 [Terracidiphilus sp.]|nr:hypothetical protein [Terracidiphilus sp.]MDR3776638.1 hypothetical protein [Terracidiphilus sp.]